MARPSSPRAVPTRTRLRRAATTTGEIVRDLAHEWREDRVSGLAAEVAFFGLLGLFPALLGLAAMLGSLEVLVGQDVADRAQDGVVDFMERMLTHEAAGAIDAVQQLFAKSNPGVLTVSAVLAVWAASRGFVAVINALHVAYDIDERRGYLTVRALAVGLAAATLVVGTLMLTMLIVGPLFGAGKGVADEVGAGQVFATLWDWVRWPVVLSLMVAWAATVFHIAPNHRTPWRWDLPGAVFTAATWAGLSVGFRAYLRIAATTNEVLGTLGGSLIVLLWLYLLAIGMLLGGELNAVLVRRHGVPQLPDEPRRLPGRGLRAAATRAAGRLRRRRRTRP